MPQKLLNIFLGLMLIILLALFSYKTTRQPNVLSVDASKNSQENSAYLSAGFSKEELDAAIKEYLMTHPEDIMASLESMQQKRMQEDENESSNYLKTNKNAIENAENPPVLGNEDGDISIVVFYDYTCSYCQKANDYNNQLIASDPGVKLILRPLPILGGNSSYAAKVALAIHKVAQEKFLDIHNDMMQMELINEDSMKILLKKYNLDYDSIDNELNSYSVSQLIRKNFDQAKGIGIQGAPSYIIDGNFAPGVISADKFKTIIMQLRNAKN